MFSFFQQEKPKANSPAESQSNEELGIWAKTFAMARAAQTRFTFIPTSAINTEVVQAGIRDTSLGKYGRNIIRFCYPSVGANSQSTFSRMVVDPTGFPNKNHQHIPLPTSVVTSTGYLQSACQIVGDGLFYASIVLTGLRLHNASKTEEGIIPETGLVLAEYGAAFAGGATGASVGAKIGCIGGPLFSVCGAIGGSIIGAYYGQMYVKDREKYIKENTVYAVEKVKSQEVPKSIFHKISIK